MPSAPSAHPSAPASELEAGDILLAAGKTSAPTAAFADSVQQLLAEIQEAINTADRAIARQKKFNQALHAAVEQTPREVLEQPVPKTPAARQLMEMCVTLMEKYSPETVAAAHGTHRKEQVNRRLLNRI